MWGPRSRAVVAVVRRRPEPGRAGPLLLADGRPADGRPRTPGGDLAVDFLGSGDALLDRWFGSERLKAALAWFGAQSGPPMSEPGTAAMVGWVALLHDVPPGHPVGGSGGLTAALRRRLESDGGRVVLGDGAARLLVERRRAVTGVETTSGRRIARRRRRRRLPRAAPPATLAGDAAPPALADADPPLGNGFGLVVRALTDALPGLSRASPGAQSLQGLQLLCTDRAELAAAHGDWAAGRLPRDAGAAGDVLLGQRRHPRPARPARRHDLGAVVPVRAGRRRRLGRPGRGRGRPAVAAVDRYAPGFADSVQRLYVQTPLALERELSLPRGNVMHVEMGLASMFGFRPTPALSGYTRARPGRALPGRRLHPSRRRGLGQLRPDGGPRAARRPAAAAPARRGRRPAPRASAAAAARDGGRRRPRPPPPGRARRCCRSRWPCCWS